mgnify:CR=1 FL=1
MYEYSNTGNGCLHDGEGESKFNYATYIAGGNLRCGTPYSVPYFFSFVVITSWMVINLIIAAIIDGLSQAYMERSKFINKEHMLQYIELWQQFDTKGSWKLKLNYLWVFIASIPAPIAERNLKEGWEQNEEKDNLYYFYSDSVPWIEERFKVRKYLLLMALNSIDFKLERNKKGELLGSFQEFTKAIINNAYLVE